jgi:hypothetical protein
MLLDYYLTYDQKVLISVLSGSVWIYFRTSDCYRLIPRESIFPVLFVSAWIFLNYKEPLFLPLGLLILAAYSKVS